jgi:hypothetical protein
MPLPVRTLLTSQPMRVASDPNRANSVNTFVWPDKKKALTCLPKAVGTVAAPYSPHIDLPVRPMVMLARLGKVTTPSAGAPEFLMAQCWAWVRYCWAFADPEAHMGLRLSPPASSLVQHQRQRLSEELGIATTLEAATRYLRHIGPMPASVEAVDVEEALLVGSAAGIDVRQVQGTKMHPDYFLVRHISGRDDQVWSLECKGTHAKAASLETLFKAAAQVQGVYALRSAGPGSQARVVPPALIGSTSFSGEKITVELLDPPGDKLWCAEPAPRAARSNPETVVELADDGSALVYDVPRFRRLLGDLVEARLLTLAGLQNSAATRIAQWPGRIQEKAAREHSEEYRDKEFGVFDGASARLPLGGGEHVEAFIGVERGILAAVQADDDQARQRAEENWHRRVSDQLDGEDGTCVVGNAREQRVTAALQEGIIVNVRLFD